MKKTLALLCALAMMLVCVPGMAEETATAPKYVFMFIGDGMGNPQVAATQYYVGSIANPDSEVPVPGQLSFTQFPYLGMMTTYDASSFCPDSASTATSMASGEKTLSGVINYDVTLTTPFKLITEYAKKAGKKVGVISSVSVDHATPAAYYAKQPSRNDYYDIALQAVTGLTVDYLAGGGFKKQADELIAIAAEQGWMVPTTNEEIRALNTTDSRVLAISPVLQDSASINYEIDRVRKVAEGEDILSLAEFVEAGIKVLDNENGFFMMCEGGKVDWSGHANDAATSIHETIALSDAVQVAVDFAAEHPGECLIIVTADHETGGMTIGFATTGYDTHFGYLTNQTISFTDFDAVIANLRENGASFAEAMAEVEKYYGLTTAANQPLSLTDTDLTALKTAYAMSMGIGLMSNEEAALLYGGYEPFSMAVSHIINNKAGLSYTSYAHTGLQIPVYAMGAGAENFSGLYDNTDIFNRTMEVMGLTK
ncbi:MAG: alkaline phosphatase [Clostridia bacterium]|nr:alkaline phosphatase [Clostridia bacterium]